MAGFFIGWNQELGIRNQEMLPAHYEKMSEGERGPKARSRGHPKMTINQQRVRVTLQA